MLHQTLLKKGSFISTAKTFDAKNTLNLSDDSRLKKINVESSLAD